MKIYLINIGYQGYDTYSGHIIVANNITQVRKLAKDIAWEEGEYACEMAEVSVEGTYTGNETTPFILLSSFHAG